MTQFNSETFELVGTLLKSMAIHNKDTYRNYTTNSCCHHVIIYTETCTNSRHKILATSTLSLDYAADGYVKQKLHNIYINKHVEQNQSTTDMTFYYFLASFIYLSTLRYEK